MGTKAERRAARERVNAYHQAQLAELLSHVIAAVDRYRDGQGRWRGRREVISLAGRRSPGRGQPGRG